MPGADLLRITEARRYFEQKFPGWSIRHEYDAQRGLEVFMIEGGLTSQRFTVKITQEFLRYGTEEIAFRLNDWQVGDFVKVSGPWPILITRNGLQNMR